MENQIIEPNIEMIKSNEFYLFYEMMMQALKTDDVKEGINSSLRMLREYLNSGNISLYRKNADGKYVFKLSDSPLGDMLEHTSWFVNNPKNLSEKDGIFKIDFNISETLKNMIFIYTRIKDMESILCINNYDETKKLEPLFWERLKDTITIIQKRAASYERNMAAISTDLLTGLDNRNSYELKIQNIDESSDKIVFAIFDLFRLKYVNDNYSHIIGDNYIKSTAKILNRYWPKYTSTINKDGTETFYETGHSLYRVGGDEFILITDVEDIKLTRIKANLAALEVQNLRLVNEELPVGINCGITKHIPGDPIKETYTRADELMSEDKKLMYQTQGLDRRR